MVGNDVSNASDGADEADGEDGEDGTVGCWVEHPRRITPQPKVPSTFQTDLIVIVMFNRSVSHRHSLVSRTRGQ